MDIDVLEREGSPVADTVFMDSAADAIMSRDVSQLSKQKVSRNISEPISSLQVEDSTRQLALYCCRYLCELTWLLDLFVLLIRRRW